MLNRRSFLTAAAAVPATFMMARGARAAEPEIFSDVGVALRGADPVAYFTQNAPVAGVPDHALMWKGTTWQFASAAHMALFEGNPEAYAPQYGGYCAWAMAEGYVATSVPEAWTIHDNKLFLNYSRSIRRRWERDIPGNVVRGDANWPDILG